MYTGIPIKRLIPKIFFAAFFLGAFLSFTPSASAAPCAAFQNDGWLNYFFDDFEQTEYVGGFLVYHFRLKIPYNDGRNWGSGLVFYDADCHWVGAFPPVLNTWNTAIDPHIRNFSVRFASSTHYDIWNDETNAKESCVACSVDIPTFFGNGATYTSVSFRGSIDGGASTIFSTSLPIYVQATSSPPVPPPNHPPTLSFPLAGPYAGDGIDPNKGSANTTLFSFKVIYSDADNDAPDRIQTVVLNGGTATSTLVMSPDKDVSVSPDLRDGNYSNGEQYTAASAFPQGQYGYVFEASDATTIAATVRFPETGELSFTTGYSSILFLPGLEASRLYRPDTNNGTKQLWEPNGDSDAAELSLDENGTSVRNDIYTKDAIDNAYIPVKGNVYASFLADLERWKSDEHLIADYGVAPYDWRLSLDDILSNGRELSNGRLYYAGELGATSTPFIIQELRRLAGSSKTGKVTIVAHSNGGLVAKALTEKLGAEEAERLIDTIIFVAVPQVGTPQAIGALLHGFDQGLPLNLFPFALSPQAARQLALNMPSAYPLLPSANYFISVDDPVVTIDATTLPDWASKYGASIHSQERLRNFITDTARAKPDYSDLTTPEIGNAALFDQAAIVHDDLDNWTAPHGVDVVQIAGWGGETLSGIGYRKVKTCHGYLAILGVCSFTTDDLTLTPKHVVDGDGTVVVPSALWTSAMAGVKNYWVDLKRYNNDHWLTTLGGSGGFAPFEHANILEVKELRPFISDLITNNVRPLSAYTYVSTSSPVSTETRLHFTLHSPLTLEFYDALGNHVGLSTTTGRFDLNIPGVNYERYGDVQWLSLPKDLAGQLIMRGTGSGSFTLEAEEAQGNNTVSTASFEGIPSSTSTVATMNIIPAQSVTASSTLLVDEDGDGATDITLQAQENSAVTLPPPDRTPPEALLSFATSTRTLIVAGLDASSSPSALVDAASTSITDASGNTLRIPFLQYKEKNKRVTVAFNELVYNGSTTTIATTTLKYKWNTNKRGEYTMFAAFVRTGSSTLEAHYRPKKNLTVIMQKPVELDDKDDDDEVDARPTRQKLSGMMVPGVQTQKGSIVAKLSN